MYMLLFYACMQHCNELNYSAVRPHWPWELESPFACMIIDHPWDLNKTDEKFFDNPSA